MKEIVEAADNAGVPVFLEDNLEPLFKKEWSDKSEHSMYFAGLRQELPLLEAEITKLEGGGESRFTERGGRAW